MIKFLLCFSLLFFNLVLFGQGNITISPSAVVEANGGLTIIVNDANLVVNGSFNGNNGSTVEIKGTAAPDSRIDGTGNIAFGNLTIDKTNRKATLAANCSINNNLSVLNGTFDLGSFAANRVASGGTLTVSDGATLKIGGSNTLPSNYASHFIGATSTIEYNGSNQSVATLNSVNGHGHLTVSGTGAQLNSGDITVRNNVTIAAGSLNINTHNLIIGGSITNSGTLYAHNGGIEMNGATAQTIPAATFHENAVRRLTVNNNAGVTLAGPLNLTDALTVSQGTLDAAGHLTLKSTAAGTARVAPVTSLAGTPVSGNVTVERHISSKRAFRLLTAPVNTAGSIRFNWMENTNNTSVTVNSNPVPDYGTHISGLGGSSNGFDATQTNNPSLFMFNNQTQAWTPVISTSGSLKAGEAYRILIRGNRSTSLNSNDAPSSATTLRATGTLATGPIVMSRPGGGGTPGMPELSSAAGGYSMIGNPYASPVDWHLLEKNNLASSIYIFDPTITGSNGRGAYVCYNTLTGTSNISSLVDNNIQSGHAFFVQTTASNPTLTFRETHKSTTSLAVFRTSAKVPYMSVELLLPQQVNGSGSADGTTVYFSNDYSNSLGDEDSYKFTNQGENLAILREGKPLSIEGRKPINTGDSIPLKIWQLALKSYALRIKLNMPDSSIEGFLNDKYLNTSLPLTAAETVAPFSITADAASAADDRFKVVFRNSSTLPVHLTGIKAYEKNKGVQVEWTAESESNMEKYEVERSANAQQFATIGAAKAKNMTGVLSRYDYLDNNPMEGKNYYRIKSVDKSGDVKFSAVVRVEIAGEKNNTISVINNPVQGNSINLLFNNAEKGDYTVTLINAAGEKVYAGNISYTGGIATRKIQLKSNLPGGIYQLRWSNGAGIKNIPVLVQ